MPVPGPTASAAPAAITDARKRRRSLRDARDRGGDHDDHSLLNDADLARLPGTVEDAMTGKVASGTNGQELLGPGVVVVLGAVPEARHGGGVDHVQRHHLRA
jgi:hypothetical protein